MANELARHFRSEPSFLEKRAWEELRALRRSDGLHVRRQHPVGRYIADFLILKHRLIIEIDGAIHERLGLGEQDAIREQRLRRQGYDLLRFAADDVLQPGVMSDAIRTKLKKCPPSQGGPKSLISGWDGAIATVYVKLEVPPQNR